MVKAEMVEAVMVEAVIVEAEMVEAEIVEAGADEAMTTGEAVAHDPIPLPGPANLSRTLNRSAKSSPNLPKRLLTIR